MASCTAARLADWPGRLVKCHQRPQPSLGALMTKVENAAS